MCRSTHVRSRGPNVEEVRFVAYKASGVRFRRSRKRGWTKKTDDRRKEGEKKTKAHPKKSPGVNPGLGQRLKGRENVTGGSGELGVIPTQRMAPRGTGAWCHPRDQDPCVDRLGQHDAPSKKERKKSL